MIEVNAKQLKAVSGLSSGHVQIFISISHDVIILLGVSEKHAGLVQDLCEDSEAAVSCAIMGWRWGYIRDRPWASFLYATVMDRLTDEFTREFPRTMTFANNSESREQVEENLEVCYEEEEEWKSVEEERMHVCERQGDGCNGESESYRGTEGGWIQTPGVNQPEQQTAAPKGQD